MMRFFFSFLLLYVVSSFVLEAQTARLDGLRNNIEAVLHKNNARVGIAATLNGSHGSKLFSIHGDDPFPCMSVYKFHLALAVLHFVEHNGLSISDSLFMSKSNLFADTYSPLRDSRPEGDFKITIADLIRYSVSLSDNNACDLLFGFVGGPGAVNSYIKQLGINGVAIETTEQEMYHDHDKQYCNTISPNSAVMLLERFEQGSILNPEHTQFLKDVLIQTSTGANKIKGQLPPDLTVGHKTGSSYRTNEGVKIADNDIAIIYLPNGGHYSLAVLMTNTSESDQTNAQIISEISHLIYEYMIGK